ncbi:MAG: hypothetical protein HY681_13185 [Chloroflexi bacterium]|nr:hypothetical protein [Chloroflexota bacterium]
MAFAKNLAVFSFNHILRPVLRLNLLVLAVLVLTLLVVLGAATGSEYFFLLGIFGFIALPLMLGFIAVILLPFR